MKLKFFLTKDVRLVLERDGSIVQPDFEMVKHLAAMKEAHMIIKSDEVWNKTVVSMFSGNLVRFAVGTYGLTILTSFICYVFRMSGGCPQVIQGEIMCRRIRICMCIVQANCKLNVINYMAIFTV